MKKLFTLALCLCLLLCGCQSAAEYPATQETTPTSTVPTQPTELETLPITEPTDIPEEDVAILEVPYTAFTIRNAEGQTISFDGEKRQSDIEIIDETITYSNLSTLILTVPNSSSFTYTTDYEKPAFSVVTSQYSSSASGSGITSVTIDSNGSVQVEGSNLDICVSCYTPWSNGQFLDVKGAAGEKASMQYTQDGITIEGFTGDGTIVVGDYYGNDSTYAFSFPDTLVTAKTLAELLAQAELIKED